MPEDEVQSVLNETGRALREARRRARMSQDTAAELDRKSGSQLSRIEAGSADPKFSTVLRIGRGLGLPISHPFQAGQDILAAAKLVPRRQLEDRDRERIEQNVPALSGVEELSLCEHKDHKEDGPVYIAEIKVATPPELGLLMLTLLRSYPFEGTETLLKLEGHHAPLTDTLAMQFASLLNALDHLHTAYCEVSVNYRYHDQIAAYLAGIPQCVEVWTTTGPCDLFVKVTAGSEKQLTGAMDQIARFDGLPSVPPGAITKVERYIVKTHFPYRRWVRTLSTCRGTLETLKRDLEHDRGALDRLIEHGAGQDLIGILIELQGDADGLRAMLEADSATPDA